MKHVTMPAGVPPKGKAFFRFGVKYSDGSRVSFDGGHSAAHMYRLMRDMLREPPEGCDEGIEAAFNKDQPCADS